MPPRRPYQKLSNEVFAAVIRDYMDQSPKWKEPPPKGYSDATKDAWRRELELAARPSILGAVPIEQIRPSLVQAFLDGLADRPGKQANALTALKQLEKWAIVRERLPYPITYGCEVDGVHNGHVPWTNEQVELAERHARPDLARLVTMAANTGQRSSDLIKMRWTDIENIDGRPGINVVQRKTARKLWVPFTRPLIAAMAAWERKPGFIILNKKDRPWRSSNVVSSAWDYHRDTTETLKPLTGLVIHGLRATACVRLNQAGANSRQIADMVGMSERMVERYLRFSVQKENAVAAVIHLDARGTAGKSLKSNNT
jgi:integrase